MAVKAVLILTAGFGEGHNAAARNLKAAFADVAPEVRVEMHDVFADAYGWANTVAVRGYITLINWLPVVWEWVFRWIDRSSTVRDKIGIFGRAAKRLQSIVEELKPDVLVTVYPGYIHLLDYLGHRSGLKFPSYVTLVTDSITVNSVWHSGDSAAYVVANEETRDVMAKAGVPNEKLHVLGFPVPLIFADIQEPKSAARAGEHWKVLFMVNSGKRVAEDVVHRLLTIEGIELTVTVGRDEVLEKKIRRISHGADHARVYGWTGELPRLMAESHVVVSKAGGATVQECLAAKTPMIINQVVPGQEEGNARLVIQSGAGVFAESPEEIEAAVRRMINSDGAGWRRCYESTSRLSRPDAARRVARWLSSIEWK